MFRRLSRLSILYKGLGQGKHNDSTLLKLVTYCDDDSENHATYYTKSGHFLNRTLIINLGNLQKPLNVMIIYLAD